MLHRERAPIGSMGIPRPTVHLEHPPSIPRSPYTSSDSTANISMLSSPTRPPASFTRTSSSRSDVAAPPKRPFSSPSSRQSSSDSIDSVSSSTSCSRLSPISSIDTPASTDATSAEEDHLVQMVYTSSARSRNMSTDEIKSILRASRRNNSRLGITGLLLYRDGTFAQFLEGPADAVDTLYDSIERDPRHHGVIRLLRQHVTKRDFKQWHMAFRDLDMVQRRSPSAGSGEVGDEISPEDHVNEGFSQLMNVGLRVGDASDDEYRPDALGNAKLDLPADMSAPMRKLVTTFYRLMDRPL